MSVIKISSEGEYNRHLSNSGQKLVVVDFFATWCGPCKAVTGPYESLAGKYSKGAIFLKVDVDELSSVSSAAKVTAMPTFHVYRQGSLLGNVQGANLGEVEGIIRQYYKEVDAFSGAGSKLGSSSGTTSENPFHALFKQYAPQSTNQGCPEEEEEAAVVECELQLRLWDGSITKATFPSNATLAMVCDHIKENIPNCPQGFRLTTQFPRRVYEGEALNRTLHQEKLTNRGQLTVQC